MPQYDPSKYDKMLSGQNCQPHSYQVILSDLIPSRQPNLLEPLGGGAEKLVSLSPGDLKYRGPEELTQYYVKKYVIKEALVEEIKVLSVSITFGRRLLGTILTVYLPTVILIVICHATNFFKPFFFEAVVTVNLTGDKEEDHKQAETF